MGNSIFLLSVVIFVSSSKYHSFISSGVSFLKLYACSKVAAGLSFFHSWTSLVPSQMGTIAAMPYSHVSASFQGQTASYKLAPGSIWEMHPDKKITTDNKKIEFPISYFVIRVYLTVCRMAALFK